MDIAIYLNGLASDCWVDFKNFRATYWGRRRISAYHVCDKVSSAWVRRLSCLDSGWASSDHHPGKATGYASSAGWKRKGYAEDSASFRMVFRYAMKAVFGYQTSRLTKKRPAGPIFLLSLLARVRGLTRPNVRSWTFLRGKQGGRVSSSSWRMLWVEVGVMILLQSDVAWAAHRMRGASKNIQAELRLRSPSYSTVRTWIIAEIIVPQREFWVMAVFLFVGLKFFT